MDWIRAHYDRFSCPCRGVLSFSMCVFRLAAHGAVRGEFAALQSSPPQKKAGPLPAETALQDAAEGLRQPAQWTVGGRSGLFVPEKHFIGPNGLPATLQNTEVHPPVPNEWLEQFGLPIADADVLTQDPDGEASLIWMNGNSTPIRQCFALRSYRQV